MQRQHLASLLFIFTLSCSFPEAGKQKQEDPEHKLPQSKFVYMDVDSTIHVDLDCYVIGGKITNGEYTETGHGVRRILKRDLTDDLLGRCCRKCISDARFVQLKEETSKNKKAPWVP